MSSDFQTNRISFLQLASVAADLNIISDSLGKYISEIDEALKNLNLGISVWVEVRRWDGEHPRYYYETIGYAKVAGKWGIALQSAIGSHDDPEEGSAEQWLFNDAPRKLRLAAIDKLPELLKKL